MTLYCMSCKHTTEKSPCEHCGSTNVANVLKLDTPFEIKPVIAPNEDEKKTFRLADILPSLEFKMELTPEQTEKLERMLPEFDVSRFIGIPCATCGEPFTQGFFDAGGTIIRTGDDRWQHDHCSSQN